MSFKAKAIAGVAAAASLAASGAVIATTSQSSHSLPEAQKAAQKQPLGEGDGWVEAAIATQDAMKHENKEEIDLGNLPPRSKGEGNDHRNERSQAADHPDKEDRGDEEGDERNDNEKVILCHRTGSGKNPGVTITVSVNAQDAHVRHGDDEGECPSSMRDRAQGQRDAHNENRGAGHGKSSARGATGRGHEGPPKDKSGR